VIDALYQHMEWADATVWRAIAATPEAETDQKIRAQVNTRLRELGATPPLVDFIAWAWFGKPAAEWP
jgi:uncharacterized damage-inducible protein DinB